MKRVFKVSLALILLLSVCSFPVLAESAGVTEYRSSYDTGNYFDFSVSGNTMTLSGVRRNGEWLMTAIGDGYSDGPFDVGIGKYFSRTYDLSGWIGNGNAKVQIASGNAQYGQFIYEYYGSDVVLAHTSGAWRFSFDDEVLKNNVSQREKWLNPGDALAKTSNSGIKTLSDSIVGGEKDDYIKLLLIHNWVADNIYYDYDSFYSGSIYIPDDPMEIVNDRKTVCEGYSILTQALVQAQGIPCLIVFGYAAGIGTSGSWSDAETASTPNHAWNEAYAEGRWVIVDTTWDSLNTYSDGKFTPGEGRYLNYFDTSEEQFSKNHKIIVRGYADACNIPSGWAQSETGKAIAQKLVPYALQGAYGDAMKRRDFCGLAVNLLEVKEGKCISDILAEKGLTTDGTTFSDCADGDVLSAAALGIINGKGGGLFDPEGAITRQEAAALLYRTARLLGISAPGGSVPIIFSDSGDFAEWAKNAIRFVSSAADPKSGIPVMRGTEGNLFAPNALYTREQSYCTILRLYDAGCC